MTSFPDPDRDGKYYYRAVNAQGHVVRVGIDADGNADIILPTVEGGGNFFAVRRASDGVPVFTVNEQGEYTDKNSAPVNYPAQSQPGLPSPTPIDLDYETLFNLPKVSTTTVVCNMDLNGIEITLPRQGGVRPLFIYVIRREANANPLTVVPNLNFGPETINGGPSLSIVGAQTSVLFIGVTQFFVGATQNWLAFNLPLAP